MHGDLDVPALVRALRYLVDRHTVLSSHFMIAVRQLTSFPSAAEDSQDDAPHQAP